MRHFDSSFDRWLDPESRAAYLRDEEPILNIYVILFLAAWIGLGLLFTIQGKRSKEDPAPPAPIEQRADPAPSNA